MDSKWNVIKQKRLMDTFLKHLDYKPKSIQQELKIEIAKILNKSLLFSYSMVFQLQETAGSLMSILMLLHSSQQEKDMMFGSGIREEVSIVGNISFLTLILSLENFGNLVLLKWAIQMFQLRQITFCKIQNKRI